MANWVNAGGGGDNLWADPIDAVVKNNWRAISATPAVGDERIENGKPRLADIV